jgi:cytochrome oxidase assembly protein ShyY1
MNFMRIIISIPRTRAFAWVTLAMLVGVALTVRLGFWQLSRAADKEARHTAIVAQMTAPVLDTATLLAQPAQFEQLHQRVALQGEWLPEHTVYLDNRPMNGRAGFCNAGGCLVTSWTELCCPRFKPPQVWCKCTGALRYRLQI